MQDTEILERVGTVGAPLPEGLAEAVFVEDEEEEHLGWSQGYDISVVPNDFNISTLCNFLDKGVIVIPEFQRDFVWDKRKASRFIESVAVGLPVPELFFYRAEPNKWWVVDGQQRLMSIYYFRNGLFPRAGASAFVSRHLRENNEFPDEMLIGKSFSKFALDLKSPGGDEPGELHEKMYEDLREQIELRPLRTIVIRQHNPDGDNAAFEIFDRLNTGGVKLSPQQIRTCVYQSPFLRMVDELNFSGGWRNLYGKPHPEKTRRDAQMILRAFAMLSDGDNYKPGMLQFLNRFCRKTRDAPEGHESVVFPRKLFEGFLRACENAEAMFRPGGKFQISILEAVFAASLGDCFRQRRMPEGKLDADSIAAFVRHQDFQSAIQKNSTSAANVRQRLDLARKIILPL